MEEWLKALEKEKVATETKILPSKKFITEILYICADSSERKQRVITSSQTIFLAIMFVGS